VQQIKTEPASTGMLIEGDEKDKDDPDKAKALTA